MHTKYFFSILTALSLLTTPLVSSNAQAQPPHNPKHFHKIMVVIFENMSYAEIKNEPTFKKLVEYSGYSLDTNGKLVKLSQQTPSKDVASNGYAFFSNYYNNYTGGTIPTRPSQPNYIAMTSGSIQNVFDNANHDLQVDNLAAELIDANITWKVYAEDLPDLGQDSLTSHCFTAPSYPSDHGYQRKHEPLISYVNIQKNEDSCKKIVNSRHLFEDMHNLPEVAFYIPNQINDGHDGSLAERVANANAFLSTMMGTNPKTGEPLPESAKAPFQRLMSQGGLLVITFDEPSTTGNSDKTIYTLLAGKMIHSGAYPDRSGNNSPTCYPLTSEQTKYPADQNGTYERYQCNNYNLLKMIEDNWQLRGLNPINTSAGYKYALPLDNGLSHLWND